MYINNLSGALAQGVVVQKQKTAETTQRDRLARALAEAIDRADDELAHQVERQEDGSREPDEKSRRQQKRRQPDDESHPDAGAADAAPGLDLKA